MGTNAVLVVNAGSSSLKAAVVQVAANGNSHSVWQAQQPLPDRPCSIEALLGPGLERWLAELTLVGHRIVHGGEQFQRPTRLDDQVRQRIAQTSALAPLHNATALAVIHGMETWLARVRPGLEQWACFDTAFHCTLPPEQRSYAIPAAWRSKGLRRYGFHGLNHQHVAETVLAIHREEGCAPAQLDGLRLISAHLGAGCSLCAIQGGHSRATTMGFTPLEGLVMATRSGSIDPGLLLHLLQHEGLDAQSINDALQHSSGLLGLSELSGDMRELRQAASRGHAQAQLAIDVFTARLREGIGAMAAVLGGVDVIALSGGIGQNDEVLAHSLHSALQWMGPFRLLQIPADEEGQIARQCWRAARGR